MSNKINKIIVYPMLDEKGYTSEDAFVSDSEVERVVDLLVEEINNLRERIEELESK